MACCSRSKRDGHSSRTPVARRVKQPTRMTGPDGPDACASTSFLFGLAPGGVCRAVSIAGNAVRSYRTVSPLPRPKRYAAAAVSSLWHCPWGLTPAGRYPAPFVHGARTFLPGHLSALAGAAVRPTDGIGMGIRGRNVKRRAPTGLRKPHTRHGRRQPKGAGRVSINARNVSSVEGSAIPSTRAWRKWR
jgi:hypothetical protein